MTVTILTGDCREVLRTLPDESVHCVVTSPPYWGLRDYGTAKWEGGDAECDHKQSNYDRGERSDRNHGGQTTPFLDICRNCGARRIDSQIGLESDFNAYVGEIVEVFREVRRVLRKDGTLWMNMGDSYANYRSANGGAAPGQTVHSGELRGKPAYNLGNLSDDDTASGRIGNPRRANKQVGLKEKDLCGIPWRVAFALQADGWYLRQDIIWSKPNPMPESVTDRCTKAHEYLFLLSKSERYYYDAEAIREPASENTHQGYSSHGIKTKLNEAESGVKPSNFDGYRPSERNRRSVWEIATAPFPEAHFATFPPALIEPCILAGCPKGGAVLDPFGGAGTTGLVADRFGRNAILIELNREYAAMSERRIREDAGMFTQIAPVIEQPKSAEQFNWDEMWARKFDYPERI